MSSLSRYGQRRTRSTGWLGWPTTCSSSLAQMTATCRSGAKNVLPRTPAAAGYEHTLPVAAEQGGDARGGLPRPACSIDADPDRLRHALDNLVANALRVAPSGGGVQIIAPPRPMARRRSPSPDTGPGFSEEFLPHAFEQFHRPDQARSDDSGGSGLGLAIVQAVAEAHGGTCDGARPVRAVAPRS